MEKRIEYLERENKALQTRYIGEAEERVRVAEEGHAHEVQKLRNKIKEMEKSLEMKKIYYDERMNLA